MSLRNKLQAFDVFSGIGGFRLATEDRCDFVGFCEIDKYANKVYESNFHTRDEIHVKDIECLMGDNIRLPEIDILFAGFPCQAFSSAGYEAGFNDPRGELFFKLARLIEKTQPRYILLENVKGLLYHDGGNTIETIKNTLTGMDYDIHLEVLDASNFGLPQKRERLFICGFRDAEDSEAFEGIENIDTDYKPVIRDILEGSVDECHFLSNKAMEPIWDVDYVEPKRGRCIKKIYPLHRQKAVYDINGLSPTAREGHGDFIRIQQDDGRIRRLSPREGLALQGFPALFDMVDTSITKQYVLIGNAVPVPVVKYVFERMVENV